MEEKISVVLVGINGYGSLYLRELLSNQDARIQLNGVVDINPEFSDYYDELIGRQIPIYQSIESFYKEKQADLAIISTPIHLHKEQACFCMNYGSHVLCEKPMTANPKDVQVMKDTRDKTGKFLAIGFNWSFIPSILELKKDIIKGIFGKPIRFKSMVQWPRNESYYNRSPWAGKKYSTDGSMIFDSVANNATAHFLHNLLYLNGDNVDTSSKIDTLEAELYRVNNIETFDTCVTYIKTINNVDIYFYASHATKENKEPCFQLEFENATITYESDGDFNDIVADWNDGTSKIYKGPENQNHLTKLSISLDAISNKNYQIPCGIEASIPHVLSIQAMHESVPLVKEFPQTIVRYDDFEKQFWIQDLSKILNYCYTNCFLPSETDTNWALRGKKINVSQLSKNIFHSQPDS